MKVRKVDYKLTVALLKTILAWNPGMPAVWANMLAVWTSMLP